MSYSAVQSAEIQPKFRRKVSFQSSGKIVTKSRDQHEGGSKQGLFVACR
jgi:hypothetical protein